MVKTNFHKINRQIVKIDKLRTKLLKKGAINDYKKTYSREYDMPNLNTGIYWDKIFMDESNLSTQSPMTKDKIKTIANLITKKDKTILDVGIGQGYLEEIISKRTTRHSLKGIDISAHAIQRAKKLFRGKFIVGNVLNLNKYYGEKTADLIVSLEVVEHINPSQLFKLYKMIHEILKENGSLIISIPINERLEKMGSNPSAHVRDYTPLIIENELCLNGFKIEKKIFLYAFGSFYSIKKLLSKYIQRWKPNSMIIVARKDKEHY